MRRDENADKAAQGLAFVTCEQVEELERKKGTGTVMRRTQRRIIKEARKRAEMGALSDRDTRVHRRFRHFPPGHPENDYEVIMSMASPAAMFQCEDDWLERLSKLF